MTSVTDLPGEQWLPVVGYEYIYQISDAGRVWSDQQYNSGGGFLRPYIRPDGYHWVKLYKGGGNHQFAVHELVLTAFKEPRPAGLQCRHLDGNPGNNTPSNLTWGTAAENAQDRILHGTNYNAFKTHCPHGHEYTPENTVHRRGGRYCRQCQRDRANAQYAMVRAAKLAAGWIPRKYVRRVVER